MPRANKGGRSSYCHVGLKGWGEPENPTVDDLLCGPWCVCTLGERPLSGRLNNCVKFT